MRDSLVGKYTINSDCTFDTFYPQTKIYRRMYYNIIVFKLAFLYAYTYHNHIVYTHICINYYHYYIRKRTRTSVMVVVVVWAAGMFYFAIVSPAGPPREILAQHTWLLRTYYYYYYMAHYPYTAYTHIELNIPCMWPCSGCRSGSGECVSAMVQIFFFLHPPLASGVAVPVNIYII